jgi:hypothetical protein
MVSVEEEKPKDKNLTLLSLQAENATRKKLKGSWRFARLYVSSVGIFLPPEKAVNSLKPDRLN